MIGKGKKDIRFYFLHCSDLIIWPERCLRDFTSLDYVQKCDLKSVARNGFAAPNID